MVLGYYFETSVGTKRWYQNLRWASNYYSCTLEKPSSCQSFLQKILHIKGPSFYCILPYRNGFIRSNLSVVEKLFRKAISKSLLVRLQFFIYINAIRPILQTKLPLIKLTSNYRNIFPFMKHPWGVSIGKIIYNFQAWAWIFDKTTASHRLI